MRIDIYHHVTITDGTQNGLVLEELKKNKELITNIMGKLDALVQGISDFRAETAAEKAEVSAAFENLDTKINELTALVEAGQLDEEVVAQATADVATARDEVKGIFTPKVEEPPVDDGTGNAP